MKILISGGSGFVGAAIAEALYEKHPDWDLTVLDLRTPALPMSNVSYIIGDVTNVNEMRMIMVEVRPVVVIHAAGIVPQLASRYRREGRHEVFRVNVQGTRNMLGIAKSTGVKAFVWTGSCTVVTDDFRYQYPNMNESWPRSNQSLIYGESKVSRLLNCASVIGDS